jgi:Sel1 repeat
MSMWRISNFRSIDSVAGSRYAAIARAAAVTACCLVAPLDTALADAASDRSMATRYEQSAQAGDDDAQFYLGALYSSGVGRPRSDQEAFRWFSRATNQGHAHSMLILAGLYASGRGVTKDSVKAYSWAYIVASASKADEDRNGARQLMSLLMKRMTSDEIGRAVVDARAWRAVRTGGASKSPYIERAGDADQPTQAAAPPPPPPAAPAVVQQAAPAVVQQPAAVAAPAVTQPAPSSTFTRATPTAPAVKNAKRDDAREIIDQVPPNLRKRFGF